MRTILHVITGLEMGGAERVLLRLIKGLPPDSYQHQVITLTPGGSMLPAFSGARIKITQLDFRRRPAKSFLQLLYAMHLARPDIVQTWMYHADLLGGVAARLLGNRKVIWGIRTSSVSPKSRATAGVQRLCAWMSKLVPHTIVCVAEASRKAHISKGYDAARMVVVRNGFEFEKVARDRRPAALRRECGFDDSHLVIGNLARFDPDKDLENFVRAAGLLAPYYTHVRFLIVGYRDESERMQVEKHIAETGNASRFRLLPESDDPSACLRAMDVFCLSSRNEGFPNVVGEAMAESVPCVVTDVGDTALLVGDTGIVVPKENAIALASGLEQILRMSAADRSSVGRRACARVRNYFTVGHTIAQFQEVYESVMKGKGLTMCGFTGFMGGSGWDDSNACGATLAKMTGALTERGPDDAGYWIDRAGAIALGHRRLAIVDLSPAGHQPMSSSSTRWTIAYNGEIYNHMELRAKLEAVGRAPAWRGHSDTETLLAGFDAWGVQATVEKAIGMFAFAAWDAATATLTLGRDRLGEKPLYYGWQGWGSNRVFLFGSDLAALRCHPNFENSIDRDALTQLLRHNYIPAPHAIYEGISKLMAGHLLTISLRDGIARVSSYWSGVESYRHSIDQPFKGTSDEAVDVLEGLLTKAVGRQMMSDVPLGAFLSGGVDSSTVVALMQAQSSRPVRTFSIGFHEEQFNEAEHAKAVAAHLGTDHTELYVRAQEAMEVIPRLPTIYSEPFSDSSQIPTFIVSQLARRHVTVALSGDAGDELFCGYNRYSFTASLWDRLRARPLALRRAAARMLTSLSPETWNQLARVAMPMLPPSLQFANVGDKLHKGARVLHSQTIDDLYLNLISHWKDPGAIVMRGNEPEPSMKELAAPLAGFDDMQRMMALDIMRYLPDDILVKVDRAAMAVSLETRVPFLDREVVEFAMSLPGAMKLRGGVTKWALRQVLYRHVPAALIERPKMGFGVPIGQWLRGPLREWGAALLDESRLRREGYFNPAPVVHKWREHLSGHRNWQYELWNVLMFQAWLEHQQHAA